MSNEEVTLVGATKDSVWKVPKSQRTKSTATEEGAEEGAEPSPGLEEAAAIR